MSGLASLNRERLLEKGKHIGGGGGGGGGAMVMAGDGGREEVGLVRDSRPGQRNTDTK